MSVNDKVKVIWKINCEWPDCPHFPKRKDIKHVDENKDHGKRWPSLEAGDALRIKFGTKWYDAEVVEKWESRSWKG